MRKRWKWLMAVAVVLFVGWCALGYEVSKFIVRPRNSNIGARADLGGVPVQNVSITAEDNVKISAWFAPGKQPDRAVILAAGIDANRGALVSRGEFYLARGYAVLLPDLRGTGESDATPVTIGWEERKDVLACLKFLKDRGYTHVGADGHSLGASAIAYSMQAKPDYAFVVLESCYDNLDHAWRNRLAMYHVPHVITLPVRWFTESMLGQSAEKLAPVDYMPQCTMPALIVAGDSEPELKTSETDAIFQQCASPKKVLHLFKGGRHQDFLSRFTEEYKEVVGGFVDSVAETWEKAPVTLAAS